MRSITLFLFRRNLRSYAAPRLTCKQPSCLLHTFVASPPLQRKCLQENSSRTPLLFQFRFASSSAAAKKVGADEKLKRVLESEIECADETDDLPPGGGFQPDGFPFQIIDKYGEQTITLKRDFAGENIEVNVYNLDMTCGKTFIHFLVNISRGEGPCLEFKCFASLDEITIFSLLTYDSSDMVVFKRREFSGLGKNLQTEFYEYLEVRGIKRSLTNFLLEYMICKDNKDYLGWLKDVKDFFEN